MLTLSDAARLAGGELASTDAEMLRVVTDSRAVQRGDLFVALKGEHFDAHDFVAEVLAKGAAGAVVCQDFALPGAALIKVDDTRLALGRLAAGWRARFELPLVGITGSNGKTTVKEMLTAILAAHAGRDAVLATAGNFNNDIGLPLTLLGLHAGHRYAVIEMGMNHFGEIRYLTGLARPRVALVNNALRAHLGGGFSGTADIARAKSEIFEGLAEGGVAVINADDPNAAIFRAAAGSHRLLSFGLGEADVNACDVALSDVAARFTLRAPQGEVAVELPAPGEHNVRNALAAAAAALALEVPLATIAAGLAGFAGVKGRLQRKRAANGAALIDDTYNANPDSMKAGIDVLLQSNAPRWFVMGDIGELGETAAQLHAEVGAYAQERGLDVLLTLGELSRHATAAFGAGANHFDTLDALFVYLDSHLPADATVLIKGSRFMRMERVVGHLTGQDKNSKGV